MDNGIPCSSTSILLLTQFFPPVCRIWTDIFFSERWFVHTPISTLPFPCYSLQIIILSKTFFPESIEYSLLCPKNKVSVNRTWSSKLFSLKSFPLNSSTQNIQNTSKYLSKIKRRSPCSRFSFVFLFGVSWFPYEEWFHSTPELIGEFPQGNRCFISFFHETILSISLWIAS